MPKVLLVEDTQEHRTIFRLMLQHRGFTVIEAEDGASGVQTARAERPDLILMDIDIPKLNGFVATRMIRADPRTSRIPIIALTAKVLRGDRELCEEAGCDEYIAKPADPRRVADAIEKLLERKMMERQAESDGTQSPAEGESSGFPYTSAPIAGALRREG